MTGWRIRLAPTQATRAFWAVPAGAFPMDRGEPRPSLRSGATTSDAAGGVLREAG